MRESLLQSNILDVVVTNLRLRSSSAWNSVAFLSLRFNSPLLRLRGYRGLYLAEVLLVSGNDIARIQ